MRRANTIDNSDALPPHKSIEPKLDLAYLGACEHFSNGVSPEKWQELAELLLYRVGWQFRISNTEDGLTSFWSVGTLGEAVLIVEATADGFHCYEPKVSLPRESGHSDYQHTMLVEEKSQWQSAKRS